MNKVIFTIFHPNILFIWTDVNMHFAQVNSHEDASVVHQKVGGVAPLQKRLL